MTSKLQTMASTTVSRVFSLNGGMIAVLLFVAATLFLGAFNRWKNEPNITSDEGVKVEDLLATSACTQTRAPVKPESGGYGIRTEFKCQDAKGRSISVTFHATNYDYMDSYARRIEASDLKALGAMAGVTVPDGATSLRYRDPLEAQLQAGPK